jgi:hypothetical protein
MSHVHKQTNPPVHPHGASIATPHLWRTPFYSLHRTLTSSLSVFRLPFLDFFFLCKIFNSAPYVAPRRRRMMGSNPGQLRIHHRLSYAITTRLDLIHTRLDLIHTRLDLIHTRLDLIHPLLFPPSVFCVSPPLPIFTVFYLYLCCNSFS